MYIFTLVSSYIIFYFLRFKILFKNLSEVYPLKRFPFCSLILILIIAQRSIFYTAYKDIKKFWWMFDSVEDSYLCIKWKYERFKTAFACFFNKIKWSLYVPITVIWISGSFIQISFLCYLVEKRICLSRLVPNVCLTCLLFYSSKYHKHKYIHKCLLCYF